MHGSIKVKSMARYPLRSAPFVLPALPQSATSRNDSPNQPAKASAPLLHWSPVRAVGVVASSAFLRLMLFGERQPRLFLRSSSRPNVHSAGSSCVAPRSLPLPAPCRSAPAAHCSMEVARCAELPNCMFGIPFTFGPPLAPRPRGSPYVAVNSYTLSAPLMEPLHGDAARRRDNDGPSSGALLDRAARQGRTG